MVGVSVYVYYTYYRSGLDLGHQHFGKSTYHYLLDGIFYSQVLIYIPDNPYKGISKH